MKFGGHETFFLRPGWLTKGINLVQQSENVLWGSDFSSDAMGVGRNMSKSIGWWLKLCGLIDRPTRREALRLSPFGMAITRHDPYLTYSHSWWFLHLAITLCKNDNVFSWFYQTNRADRFAKGVLEGNLIKFLEDQGASTPSINTIHRDTAVLLQSYATFIPQPSDQDPEDNLDCPLRRLGLLVYRSDLGDYERRYTTTQLPAELVAAALTTSIDSDQVYLDVPLDFIGPVHRIGRIFGCRVEDMTEVTMLASEKLGSDLLTIRHLAGQRVATVRKMSMADWYQHLFNRMELANSTTTIRYEQHDNLQVHQHR